MTEAKTDARRGISTEKRSIVPRRIDTTLQATEREIALVFAPSAGAAKRGKAADDSECQRRAGRVHRVAEVARAVRALYKPRIRQLRVR